MKKLLFVVMALAISTSAMAADSAPQSLSQRIIEKEKALVDLKLSIRTARTEGGKSFVMLSKHTAEFLLVGGGTTYLYKLSLSGKDPFTMAANYMKEMDPNNGVFLGPVPRMMIRETGYWTAKVSGIATIAAGAVWSLVEAVYAAGDGLVFVVDASKIVYLEGAIQVAQEQLTTALANAAAVEQSRK